MTSIPTIESSTPPPASPPPTRSPTPKHTNQYQTLSPLPLPNLRGIDRRGRVCRQDNTRPLSAASTGGAVSAARTIPARFITHRERDQTESVICHHALAAAAGLRHARKVVAL